MREDKKQTEKYQTATSTKLPIKRLKDQKVKKNKGT